MPATAPSSVLTDALHTSVIQSRDLALNGIGALADLAAKLPSPPAFETLPIVNQVPGVHDIVDAQWALVDEIIAAQRAVAYRFVDMLEQPKA